MSPQKIPEKTFEISQLEYPLAVFGRDDSWVEKTCEAIQRINPDSILVVTYPTITGDEPKIESEQIAREHQHLQNLCVITEPIETYLELVAINYLENELRIIVYDKHQVTKGWLIIKFEE